MESAQQQKILYYLEHPDYGFLSNFYPSTFKVYNEFWKANWEYRTNQHYFQSKKFAQNAHQAQICFSNSPFDAFELGRTRKFTYRNGWKHIKQDVMYTGLKHKFDQNPELKDRLIATRHKIIYQHDDTDLYWSDGGKDGKGKNRMGILLMKLREQYRNQEHQKSKAANKSSDQNSQQVK